MARKHELTQAEIADALRVIMSVDCGVDARVVAWQRIYDNNTEQRQRIEELEQQKAALREVLQRISSGIGGDLLGTTALGREDMQSIAQQALKEHP